MIYYDISNRRRNPFKSDEDLEILCKKIVRKRLHPGHYLVSVFWEAWRDKKLRQKIIEMGYQPKKDYGVWYLKRKRKTGKKVITFIEKSAKND